MVYIYRERERDRERYTCICTYMSIYNYMYNTDRRAGSWRRTTVSRMR